MKSYKDRVEKLKKEIAEIENELREYVYNVIREVADEQKLNRISAHIYIMKFSEISGKPWDSVFHDWKQSAKMLIGKLENKRALEIYDYLVNLYDKRTKDNKVSFKYKTIYKSAFFNYYDELTQVLDGNFIKRIIDRLDGLA